MQWVSQLQAEAAQYEPDNAIYLQVIAVVNACNTALLVCLWLTPLYRLWVSSIFSSATHSTHCEQYQHKAINFDRQSSDNPDEFRRLGQEARYSVFHLLHPIEDLIAAESNKGAEVCRGWLQTIMFRHVCIRRRLFLWFLFFITVQILDRGVVEIASPFRATAARGIRRPTAV